MLIDQLTKMCVCCGQVPGDGAAMPSGSVRGGERQPPSHSVILQEARASKQRLHALSQPDPLDGRLQGTVTVNMCCFVTGFPRVPYWIYYRVDKDRVTLNYENVHTIMYVHADAEPQPKKKRSGW